MVTKLRLPTLGRRRGARGGKKQRLVQVSQLFLSASAVALWKTGPECVFWEFSTPHELN